MTSMCKYLILRGFLIFITVPQKNCIIKRNVSTKQIFDLIEDVDASLSELYRKNLIQSPVSNIKEMIETTSLALKNNVEKGLSLGKELIKEY